MDTNSPVTSITSSSIPSSSPMLTTPISSQILLPPVTSETVNAIISNTVSNTTYPVEPSITPPITTHVINDPCILKDINKLETPTPDDNGRSKCEELAQRIREIERDEKIIAATQKTMSNIINAAAPWTMVQTIVDDFAPGENEVQQYVVNTINTSVNQEIYSNATSKCLNIVDSIQKNVVNQDNCLGMMLNSCNYLTNDDNKLKCLTNINNIRINNLVLENTNTNLNKCILSSLSEAAVKNNADTGTLAVLEAIQNIAGLGVKNKSSAINCNNISNNISSKYYMNTLGCCMKKTKTDQTNIYNSCFGVDNVILSNLSSSTDNCMMNSDIYQKAATNITSSAKMTLQVDQKSEGITSNSMTQSISSSLCCSCCLVCIFLILLGGLAMAYDESSED